MNMKTVAIMQPTYFPWCGYFALMDMVDEFVLLDSVQFSRRSWQQRNQIKSPNGVIVLTVPVNSRGKRDQLIEEAEIDTSQGFPNSHIRAIEINYRKAPFFSWYAEDLFALMRSNNGMLCDLTTGIIAWLKDSLGISTPLIRSSKLGGVGNKADLLADLCASRGARRYISPPGSRGYLDESSAFKSSGIEVDYLDYEHPVYPQLYGEFEPYMSVIDLLFNKGPDSLIVLRDGVFAK